ncbi:hypothetical protein FNV43_RR07911 [Rhamnella rubrinervis]|uniref:Wax synthase domain-containing protein n=1 Tax=Rhamnella rubrinervis TaxID=2594499 RepID=A0A8K0HHG7_9ROSA|nr:hypothetical protein FNV43_RR07911 [Rhamnella rubrinervis]
MPIFYIFYILPWYYSSALARGLSSFFITWITSFKLLLFSFHQGTLVSPKNYIDFAMVAVFPLKMKEKLYSPPSPNPKLVPGFVPPILILLITFYTNSTIFLRALALALVLYIVFTSSNGETLCRYELLQLFNHPYLATSVQEFWGRRWNRMSSNILRQTVYEPTLHCLKGTVGVGPAKVVATITTLVVSGIMHELMFYHITCGMKPTWEVTWFFVLHGFCMVVETGLKHLARVKGWPSVKPAVLIVWTVGFACLTSYWLLVLPVWRSTQLTQCSAGSPNIHAFNR